MSFWDSLNNFNYKISNVNAVLGSTVTALDDSKNGKPLVDNIFNFGLNVTNGLARNDWAKTMADNGDSSGQAINALAGYGNLQANAQGTAGLMFESMVNPWATGGMMGYPMFGGMCGGSVFGGYNSCMMPMTMPFMFNSGMGYFC